MTNVRKRKTENRKESKIKNPGCGKKIEERVRLIDIYRPAY